MNTIVQILRREIAARGAVPFARFMQLALYCPDSGFYEKKEDSPGRAGSFFTSVSVGPLFGRLLAVQFAQWLDELRSAPAAPRPPLSLVEAGAHDGQLAADILDWLGIHRPEILSQIAYVILEPSPRRQVWQRQTLKKFKQVRWVSSFEDSRFQRLNGIIFSNELLDAMPVRRFGWDARARKWFEWGVTLEGDKFVWTRRRFLPLPQGGEGWDEGAVLASQVHGEGQGLSGRSFRAKADEVRPRELDWMLDVGCWMFDVSGFMMRSSSSSILHLPASLLAVLPDGYTIETCPAAENWWRQAARALRHGRLMTIDYGLTADEFFSPSRTRGTLRAYFRHHATDDLLANPGEQDLTAHVNFSAIQAAGEACGLATEQFPTQGRFLTRILANAVKSGLWEKMKPAEARQFQTLTHPDHLGRAFRVLIQSK
jgi:SAM-dependent MidA family methyltransferase